MLHQVAKDSALSLILASLLAYPERHLSMEGIYITARARGACRCASF
jgi:hypothetical protein